MNYGRYYTENVYTPYADVYQTETGYVFEFSLPGVEKESVSVGLESGGLVVSGERKAPRNHYLRKESPAGKFRRKFSLPSDADAQSVDAKLENGILSVMIGRTPSVQIAVK